MDTDDYARSLQLYERLVSTNPNVERKGASMPYTSLNGHMFSLLTKEGKLVLRLPLSPTFWFRDLPPHHRLRLKNSWSKKYMNSGTKKLVLILSALSVIVVTIAFFYYQSVNSAEDDRVSQARHFSQP